MNKSHLPKTKEINGFKSFTTSVLSCSPKKMKPLIHKIKRIKLNDVLRLLDVSHKPVCKKMYNDFKCIKYNLLNVLNFTKEEVDKSIVALIITELYDHNLGIVRAAKGRYYRSRVSRVRLRVSISIPKSNIKLGDKHSCSEETN